MSRYLRLVLIVSILALTLVGCRSHYDYQLEQVLRTDEDNNPLESTEYQYDKEHHVTSEVHKGANGSLLNTLHYTYDVDGLCTAQYTVNAKGDTIDTETYQYDGQGFRIGLNHLDRNDSLITRHEYVNDEQGRVTKDIVYDNRLRITEITERHIDRNNHLTRQGFFGLDGLPLGHEQNEFDAKGRLRFTHRYDNNNHEVETITQSFDHKNRVIAKKDSVESEGIRNWTMKYDRYGNVTQVSYKSSDGNVQWIDHYVYEKMKKRR